MSGELTDAERAMGRTVQKFFDELSEAEEHLANARKILHGVDGIDIAHDSNLQRLRRISEDVGTVYESVEEHGFGYDD